MSLFPLNYLAITSKVSDTLSFSFKNGLEYFLWVSFLALSFLKMPKNKPVYGRWDTLDVRSPRIFLVFLPKHLNSCQNFIWYSLILII